MAAVPKSPNFWFLADHDPHLIHLAEHAEVLCFEHPDLCLTRLRQLTEAMALEAAAAAGLLQPGVDTDLQTAIRLLDRQGVMGKDTADVFHYLRKAGNEAVHQQTGSKGDALKALKLAQRAAVWFHRVTKDAKFRPPPFVPPPAPRNAEEELREELLSIRKNLEAACAEREAAALRAEEHEGARKAAEEEARRAYDDLRAAMELAEETEARWSAAQKTFTDNIATVAKPIQPEIDRTVAAAAAANTALSEELDESDTRILIDGQLRAAGWEADSSKIRYARGVRPESGKNKAIAEWPTATGPVDYALFAGLTAVGVIEAKKQSKNVSSVLQQAKRYARDLHLNGHASPPAGGPWGDYRVPFIFATNGRRYLRQLETMSGVWFLDARLTTNQPRPLNGWWTPEGLLELLAIDTAKATASLAATPVELAGLRYYQKEAVSAVEEAIARGQRDILLAMATGTGKTRTCLALIYRLIKMKRFRRILFLVDREALGTQAGDVFSDVKLEGMSSLTEIYEVKQLGDSVINAETRVQVSTVQGMVKRLLYPSDADAVFPVDVYDCIVVDECHRGYILDRELSENEIGFVNELDYQSKYRRVLDHFDAVRIGLTATPALHTNEIFGAPVYTYSYRRAVVDGCLVDHEPPHRIRTALNEDGIHWRVGEEVERVDLKTGEIDLSTTPDDIDIEVDQFNAQVITEPFNKAVCGELARHIDPSLPGKTMIFCVNDRHADMVVHLLSKALEARYGPIHQDVVAKITGASDRPSLLVRRYKNEELPKIGVTVDLLTTGIDVPAIVNLVFIRRVRSRILYEQMLGRATRLCADLFGPGEDKQVFYVFDAVDLYSALEPFTSMHPVVNDPGLTVRKIADSLLNSKNEPESAAHFHDALVARLNRKRRLLESHAEQLEYRTGLKPDAFLARLRKEGPPASIAIFTAVPGLADWIDSLQSGQKRPGTLVAHHPDEVRGVERGYGTGSKPEDYLEGFGGWIHQNLNLIPALITVTQRPRDLTRAQLKDLALKLDEAGFSLASIRTAWREARNEDLAASIIGFIRSQTLGSPLIDYSERVDRAVKRVLNTQRYRWTAPQRQWLNRIATQMKKEIVVDRDALNAGQFAANGGFDRINTVFDGELAPILAALHEETWNDAA